MKKNNPSYNKKIFAIGIILGIISILITSGVIYLKSGSKPVEPEMKPDETEKIGWVTDIHADWPKKRVLTEDNIVYPKRYEEYFPAFLDKMKAENIKIVIATGDNTNSGEKKYAQKLKEMAETRGITVLWVRGNHDKISTGTMENLGVSAPYYYAYDSAKTRIIVLSLDTDETPVEKTQLDWLKEKLETSTLPVIIAAHPPIIDYDNNSPYPRFQELEKIIGQSQKVKYVLSGHLHTEKEADYNGVRYKTAYPLTLKNHLGSHYVIEVGEKTEAIRSENIAIQENN